MTIGTMINDKVTRSDFASGPNINLPPRMNFCNKKKGERSYHFMTKLTQKISIKKLKSLNIL